MAVPLRLTRCAASPPVQGGIGARCRQSRPITISLPPIPKVAYGSACWKLSLGRCEQRLRTRPRNPPKRPRDGSMPLRKRCRNLRPSGRGGCQALLQDLPAVRGQFQVQGASPGRQGLSPTLYPWQTSLDTGVCRCKGCPSISRDTR